jgi:hypothetical protein
MAKEELLPFALRLVPYMHRNFRYLWLLLLAITMSACARVSTKAPLIVSPLAGIRMQGPVHAYILDAGWHTGWALPSSTFLHVLPQLKPFFPKARELMVGWGNRRFYMARNPGIIVGLEALWPSRSVVLIQGIRRKSWKTALSHHVHLYPISLNKHQMLLLVQYIAHYIRATHGQPLHPKARPWYPHGWFFRSTGTYDAFHTCNTWTAASLKFMGFPVHPSRALLDGKVNFVANHH